MVLNVKKYSFLKEIISNIDILDNDYDIIINNSLCGDIVDIKDSIIDDDINLVVINKRREDKIYRCIKCSWCIDVCPMGINPLVKSDKCIHCGLCNYVCPSKIEVERDCQRWVVI